MRKTLISPLVVALIALLSIGLSGQAASAASGSTAKILAKVDLSQQRMHVYINGKKKYSWAVSTGKRGWETPKGAYRPIRTYRSYYEKKWRMSLPYLVLISHDGIGIHATGATGRLGRVASHGCIRLAPGHAKKFYNLVTAGNQWNTRVEVIR